ncbi:MAG: NIPSNAP family protein [Phenylobacterium sp.]
MIVEMRTDNVLSGRIAALEARVAEALPARAALSPLAGYWRTETGTLDQVIQIWPYTDLEQRARVLSEARRLPAWPPETGYVGEQLSEIYLPAPFSPDLKPHEFGGIYEIRTYTLMPRFLPSLIERWGNYIANRVAVSPLVFAGDCEFGGVNRWRHIWAYTDLAERAAIRGEVRRKGIWPPPGGDPVRFLKQETIIVRPASFSPLR